MFPNIENVVWSHQSKMYGILYFCWGVMIIVQCFIVYIFSLGSFFKAVTQDALVITVKPCQLPHVFFSLTLLSELSLYNGVTGWRQTPPSHHANPKAHLGNIPGSPLFIMWCICGVGAVHYVHNSLLTFVKTRVCMRANDPQEINDAIKKKNPPFVRVWQNPLALIMH